MKTEPTSANDTRPALPPADDIGSLLVMVRNYDQAVAYELLRCSHRRAYLAGQASTLQLQREN